MIKHAHTVPEAKYTLTPSVLNPSSPVDTIMRLIIACAKGPMMHIRVTDGSAHFNRPFGGYKRTMSLSFSRASLVVLYLCIFWLLNRLSWPLFQREIKCRILHKTATVLHCQQRIAEDMASWLEASRKAVTSPTIVSDQYLLVSNSSYTNSYQTVVCGAYQLAACGYVPTRSFLLLRRRASLKRLHSLQNIQTSSFTTARIFSMLIMSIPR